MIAALLLAAAAPQLYASCDGGMMVAVQGEAAVVWERGEGNSWEAIHQVGGPTAALPSMADAVPTERASCARAPISNTPPMLGGAKRIGGSSRDRSLLWSWEVSGGTGRFVAKLWTGERYNSVVDLTRSAAE